MARKEYRLRVAHARLRTATGSLLVSFNDEHGDLAQSFNFARRGAQRTVAAEMAALFRQQCVSHRPASRRTVFRSLCTWLDFINDGGASVASLRELDGATLIAYVTWLERRALSRLNKLITWNNLKRLLAWGQVHRSDLVSLDLEFPFNPSFSGRKASSRAALSRSEMERVLCAARTDVSSTWDAFQDGRRAVALVDRVALAKKADVPAPDLKNLGVLLAVLIDRFGGLVPTHSELTRRGTRLAGLHQALRAFGGARHVVKQYLHATPEVLTPYLLLLGAQLYANPTPLIQMQRDCLVEHVLLDGRVLVVWNKHRARRQQRRSFVRGRSMSPPLLIEQVLAITESIVARVHAKHRPRLFLCDLRKQGERVFGPYPLESSRLMSRFVDRHDLRDDAGAPLKLTLAMLRPSGLTLAYEAAGYDILKAQVLANHARPDTTDRYVSRPSIRLVQSAALGKLQVQFVESVRSGVLSHVSRPGLTARVDARNATASGFVCTDPMEGVGPGQVAGALCTAWLGCFTCPNAVIPLSVEVLARLLETERALVAAQAGMAPARWELLYAPKLAVLRRDILPRFPAALAARAEKRASDLPPAPPIE